MIQVLLFSLLNLTLLLTLYAFTTKRPTRVERIFQTITIIYSISLGLYFVYPDVIWLSTLSITMIFLPLLFTIKTGYVDLILTIKYHDKFQSVVKSLFENKKRHEFREEDMDLTVLNVARVIQTTDTVAFKMSHFFKVVICTVLVILMVVLNSPFSNDPAMHYDNPLIMFMYAISLFFSILCYPKLNKMTDPLLKARLFRCEIILETAVFITTLVLYSQDVNQIRLVTLIHVTIHHFGLVAFYLRWYSRKPIVEDSEGYLAYLKIIKDPILFNNFKIHCSKYWEESNVLFLEAYRELDMMHQIGNMKGASSFAVALSGLDMTKQDNNDRPASPVDKRSEKLKKAISEITFIFLTKGILC